MWRLSEPFRLYVAFLVILLPLFVAVAGKSERTTIHDQQCSSSDGTTYRHLVVLVHGYMGSSQEQAYLGETLIKETNKLVGNESDQSCRNSRHQLVLLKSVANEKISTDGVAMGGKRLASEISEWIEQQTAEIDGSESSTVLTFSLIGNSLGGLYGRYALAELDFFHDNESRKNPILPLVFCTTSSPHLGVAQETFIELPRWVESHVATVFQQQTMDDLFRVKNSTVVKDMCLNPSPETSDDRNDYLYPLQQFQKRIAVANAYKTDVLVSVSTGAFLSLDSDSIHQHQDSATSSTRLMRDTGHVALQVVTTPASSTTGATTESRDDDDSDESKDASLKRCVDSLDKLGWQKIFIDTRNILPDFTTFKIPELERRDSYTSKDLKEHFDTFGTLLPFAHPLNMANSRTDLYRKMTKGGQPIVDALAELMVLDMVELSEKQHQQHHHRSS